MKPWSITWAGVTVTDQTITGGHMGLIAMVDDRWEALDPWSSPSALLGWLVAIAAHESGDLLGARADVALASAPDIVTAISERESDPEPVEAPTEYSLVP